VRLFSAIPLLFWVGTAAVAHLAHVWALVPPPVTPVSQASETAIGANPDHAICSAARLLTAQHDPALPLYPPAARIGNVQPSTTEHNAAHSTRFHRQMLSAVRLSGNPPPQRA
jgi:hypothetical protein